MTDEQQLYVMTDADEIIERLDSAEEADQLPSPPSLDSRLMTLQTEASRLPDAATAFNLIEDFVDFVAAEHPALTSIADDVWHAALELAQNVQKITQTVVAAAALAAEFRSQREDALTKIAQLSAEIETCDLSNPAIASLAEQIEEYQIEMFELGFADYVAEQLWHTTPLDYEEITGMLEIFSQLPGDNILWVTFREWLDRAEIEIRGEVES
jgi:hypothetical protein